MLSGAALVCTANLAIAQPTSAPLVLYTDVASGPNSGGENGKGAYLCVFGKNFSSSGFGTRTKVTIGGAEVASYRLLRRI